LGGLGGVIGHKIDSLRMVLSTALAAAVAAACAVQGRADATGSATPRRIQRKQPPPRAPLPLRIVLCKARPQLSPPSALEPNIGHPDSLTSVCPRPAGLVDLRFSFWTRPGTALLATLPNTANAYRRHSAPDPPHHARGSKIRSWPDPVHPVSQPAQRRSRPVSRYGCHGRRRAWGRSCASDRDAMNGASEKTVSKRAGGARNRTACHGTST